MEHRDVKDRERNAKVITRQNQTVKILTALLSDDS